MTPDKIKEVAARYMRFCFDQHSFFLLNWRSRLLEKGITARELLIFRLRVSLKKTVPPQLFDEKGQPQKDPEKLG